MVCEGHKSECDINHLGSSTSMEMEAALTLWKDPHHLDSIILQYYPMVIVKRLTTCARKKVYGPDIVIKRKNVLIMLTARGGRVRSTTPAEDRHIVLSAKSNRRTTAQQVANQFLAASGKQISRKTVARRLRGGGLYACRPVVCVPLTRQHRTARLQWCREHHNWTEQDWACVLFSDERRFSLSSDCRRQLIWRENGTAYRPENIQEKDRYPTCSIRVWAGIMIMAARAYMWLRMGL
ncbi:transposable element Tcb1 transposase [Trichonephila clavipes]|nr:transposable element Tcb1 transposase [Trichonephila clavipes]